MSGLCYKMTMANSKENSISHLLTRNIEKIYPSKKFLQERLNQGEKITIYNGIDPSSPEVHIGHAVVLRKLREFQNLGHKVILLIGDFTGRIGDPTGKLTARKKLTSEQVAKNAQSYQEQVGKILDFQDSQNPVEIKFNSQWWSNLSAEEMLELSYHFTVQQMIERDMFQERLKRGRSIFLPEFFYPAIQAYDSVAMRVDAEIGGTDQTFNMLTGRTLMKAILNKEKIVITCPLLLGLDGQKMSKSLGNTIGITENPNNMYAQVMSVKDDLILHYFELTTNLSIQEINAVKKRLEDTQNPMDTKKKLAFEIVKLYHGERTALKAKAYFEKTVQKGETPDKIKEARVEDREWKVENLLVELKLASSKSEAKRLIKQGGVRIGGWRVEGGRSKIKIKDGDIVRVGKRRFVRVRIGSN